MSLISPLTIGVENAIRSWASVITGVTFYFLDSNVTRPSGLYGSIRLVGGRKRGTPDQTGENITVDGVPKIASTLYQWRDLTFSFNAYRLGARDVLQTIQEGAYLDGPNLALQAANIGFTNCSDVRDLSQDINAEFEERAQMDVTFNVVGIMTENLDVIENVPFYFETFDKNFEVDTE